MDQGNLSAVFLADRVKDYFKTEQLLNVKADVDLVIFAREEPEHAAAAGQCTQLASTSTAAAAAAAEDCAGAGCLHELNRFPAHSFILDGTGYFSQQQGGRIALAQPVADSPQPPATPRSSSIAAVQRREVHLTISSADHLPAAEAVIAAMYQVPDAISSLQQQHLVHAVVIAEMLQVDYVAQQALQSLRNAACAPQGLPTLAALQAMASLETWPAGLKQLLPLLVENTACCRDSTADLAAIKAADASGSVQNMLVGALGDLQGVWSSAEEKALLLALPLPAMQLLLSSDLVRVPSEDTVLYTAAQYVRAQKQGAAIAAAKAALVQLIRVPQLSAFALYWASQAASSSDRLLSSYAQQLQKLLFLKMVAQVTPEELITEATAAANGAPSSWGLGARQIRPLSDGVRLSWRVTVEQLKQACVESFAKKKVVYISSHGSPPMGGVAWCMSIKCQQCNGGTVVGLYLGPGPEDFPDGSYYGFECSVMWQGVEYTSAAQGSACLNSSKSWGYVNYFDLQPMSGSGWVEAAWAAAADGMPTTGEMLLELQLHSVCATP